jgi:hypothetical protein
VELTATEFGPEGDKQWVSLVGGLFYADVVGQILQTEFNELLWWDLRNGPAAITNSDNALYGWRTNASGQFVTDEGCVNGIAAPPNFYPSYYCMELLRHFAGGGDTVVAATSDCKLLSAYAMRRTNGCLTLLVINKSSSASLPAAINLDGYPPSSTATLFSYGIPQDNAAMTGIGSPEVAETNFADAGTNFTCTFPPYSASVMVLNPSPPTLAVPAAWQQSGQIVLQLQGIAGVPYVIQTSTNLASANWTSILTNVSLTGTINLTNSIVPAATYYRAIWQPPD